MSAESAQSHIDHPLYSEALYQFQRGRWEVGLASLDKLIEKYPLVPDLRSFRIEMSLRAKIDQDEVHEKSQARRRWIQSLAVRLIALASLIFVVLVIIQATSLWAERQWFNASEQLEEEIAEIELAVKFRNAQDLLEADRIDEALILFGEVQDQDPNFPDLNVYLTAANDLAQLDAKYSEGIRLVDQGNLTQGLILLEEVAEVNPFFKDVSIKTDQLKKEFLLDDLLKDADQSFNQGDWESAVLGYENIRAIDPQFRVNEFEENLFQSYMFAAELILQDEDSLEALQTAESYFKKALALRPQNEEIFSRRTAARVSIEERLVASYLDRAQSVLSNKEDSLEALGMAEVYLREALVYRPKDPDITVQLQLAQLFIDAQSDFNRGLYDQVITGLEVIYTNQPNYARGTARQTLYDSYIARGKTHMASGAYETALFDFQRAATLAEQEPDSLLRLFEAQTKIAEVQGVLGNYENATLLYRDAVDLGGLRARAELENPALAGSLAEADAYADNGNYTQAYRLYRFAVRSADGVYDSVTHVVAKGEYLTLIAALHGSTVQAIVAANDILDPNKIFTGQELIVPITPRSLN